MAYVLIIDDDEDFSSAVATILRKQGYKVEVKLELQGAAEKIEKNPPDVLILDVMFPEDVSAGFKFARYLRQKPALRRTAIAMVSAINSRFPLGFGTKGTDNDAWLPVDDFINKPVDLEVLINRVSSLIGSAN